MPIQISGVLTYDEVRQVVSIVRSDSAMIRIRGEISRLKEEKASEEDIEEAEKVLNLLIANRKQAYENATEDVRHFIDKVLDSTPSLIDQRWKPSEVYRIEYRKKF